MNISRLNPTFSLLNKAGEMSQKLKATQKFDLKAKRTKAQVYMLFLILFYYCFQRLKLIIIYSSNVIKTKGWLL